MSHLYLNLFHGRKTPDEQLDDWGSNGPIIGPCDINCTYGTLRLFNPPDLNLDRLQKEATFHANCEIHMDGGCFLFDGIWYGDWSVMDEDELMYFMSTRQPGEAKREVIDVVEADRRQEAFRKQQENKPKKKASKQ